jgi:hypothetical protein
MAETTATKKTTSKKSARKAPAKTASAKRSSAKKAPAEKPAPASKKTTAKKAPRSRKAPAKASAEAPPRRSSGARLAGAAREAVQELTGRTPESVTALERSDDGWRVAVEVLELERIPSTTDVMATYEVSLDEQGELQGYRRVHRYLRGSPGDE